ncbi:MAG: hypothetical protein C5B43_00575, partial [Verrucomicrobia bacterium]
MRNMKHSYCQMNDTKVVITVSNTLCWLIWLIILVCLGCTRVIANEGRPINETLLVTRGNFVNLNNLLNKNNSSIISLKMEFPLNVSELETLLESIQENTELGFISWHENQVLCDAIEKIEKRLIGNNENYKEYPSDYIYSLLCHDGLLKKVDLTGWQIVKEYSDIENSGYYGIIYKNDSTHQVVVVDLVRELNIKKGIDFLVQKSGNLNSNIEEILWKIIISHQVQNLQITAEAIEIANDLKYRLSFTGHGLGAWLAELSVFYCHAYFHYPNVKAVTFDSPGTLTIMEELLSKVKNKNEKIKLKNLDIVSYLTVSNTINSCNSHIGKIYRLKTPKEYEEEGKCLMDNIIEDLISDSVIDFLPNYENELLVFVAALDSKSVNSREIRRMMNWPRMEYKNECSTQSDIKMIKDFRNDLMSQSKKMFDQYFSGADWTSTAIAYGKGIKSLVNFLQKTRSNEIDRNDLPKARGKVHFKDKCKFINKLKNEESDDVYYLNLFEDRADQFLYDLYQWKSNLENNLFKMIKVQLEELLSNYEIKNVSDEKYRIEPISKLDIKNIRQKAKRLLKILPENILQKISQKPTIIIERNDKDKLATNLPLEKGNFINFNGSLDELENIFKKSSIVIITGAEGMGKSTLAAQYGWRQKKRGSQVRWINGSKIAEEFLQLAKELKLETSNLYIEEIIELVYEELERLFPKQERLFIFDNIKDKEDINPYVRDVFIADLGRFCNSKLKIIITIIDKASFETSEKERIFSKIHQKGFSIMHLTGFNEEESKVYLREELENSEEEIEQLVNTVGVSPFRLSKTVAYLKNQAFQNVEKFVEEYENIKSRNSQKAEVYPEIELLLRTLKNSSSNSWGLLRYFKDKLVENTAWELLKYLAFFDSEGISLSLLSGIIGKDIDELGKLVKDLQKLSLVNVIIERDMTKIKISHAIIQQEIQKAAIAEDATQSAKILEKIAKELFKTQKSVACINEKELCYLKEALNWKPPSSIGLGFIQLGGESHLKEGLKYLEQDMKAHTEFSKVYHSGDITVNKRNIADLLEDLATAYKALGDENKYLEYTKQVYGINVAIFGENQKKTKQVNAKIESLQPHFFGHRDPKQTEEATDCFGGNKVGSECRWFITSRGKFDEELLKIKLAIQKNVLNKIVQAVENYGWSNCGMLGDWGVKGYMNKDSLKNKLGTAGQKDKNIESAQMLCFEAMNLGIMKSTKKPYEIVESFTGEHPELVKKIAKKHPEFFVDGSIVEACVKAMPDNKLFEQHIFEH